jgi:16S rRNA (uracil1498-N3)-methyltransferase
VQNLFKDSPLNDMHSPNNAPRHFVSKPLKLSSTVELPADVTHHIGRVTRMKSGDSIALFNGDGHFYYGSLHFETKNLCNVAITLAERANTESGLSITLLQGLSSSEKMAWTIEKTTELGVTRIIPVQCQRSVAQLSADKIDKKQAHWLNIARAAAAQSGRAIVPIIEAPIFSNEPNQLEALKADNDALILLAPDSNTRLSEWAAKTTAKKIVVYIGPEGGLTEKEIKLASEHGFHNLRMGSRVLRTETAGPTVIASLQALLGDF